MPLPSCGEVAEKIGIKSEDKARQKARLAVCTIACGQEQSIGYGVLVSGQFVDGRELSKYCIITINEVVPASENNALEGQYQVTFQRKNSKDKSLDLQNITKKSVWTASGLALIFLNPSCVYLDHGYKKCSILRKSPLPIGSLRDPSSRDPSPLFCFVENQRYVVESTGENEDERVYVLKADSNTAKSSSGSAETIPHGTVILQYDADDKNLMAVGIFKEVSKQDLKISPIWFKSSLKDLLRKLYSFFYTFHYISKSLDNECKILV